MQVREIEPRREVLIVAADTVEYGFVEVHEIHLVHRDEHVLDPEQ